MATVSELLTAINDELELNISSDESAKRKVLRWMNSIYSEVINSAEYPWRKKDAVLSTAASIDTTATFTSGQTGFQFANIGTAPYSLSYGYVWIPSLSLLCALKPTMTASSGSMEQVWSLATASAVPITFYCPRYTLYGTGTTIDTRIPIREDWITGIYCQSESSLVGALPRIYPTNFYDYVMYSIKNPGQPQAWYTHGVDAYKNTLICLSPAPDSVYTYNVAYLLGATTLEESTSSTILPPEVEMDIFINGCGMLHAINRKEPEGMQLYGGRFRNIVDTMMMRTARNPGSSSRVSGYVARRAKEWDPDLPLDWTP